MGNAAVYFLTCLKSAPAPNNQKTVKMPLAEATASWKCPAPGYSLQPASAINMQLHTLFGVWHWLSLFFWSPGARNGSSQLVNSLFKMSFPFLNFSPPTKSNTWAPRQGSSTKGNLTQLSNRHFTAEQWGHWSRTVGHQWPEWGQRIAPHRPLSSNKRGWPGAELSLNGLTY